MHTAPMCAVYFYKWINATGGQLTGQSTFSRALRNTRNPLPFYIGHEMMSNWVYGNNTHTQPVLSLCFPMMNPESDDSISPPRIAIVFSSTYFSFKANDSSKIIIFCFYCGFLDDEGSHGRAIGTYICQWLLTRDDKWNRPTVYYCYYTYIFMIEMCIGWRALGGERYTVNTLILSLSIVDVSTPLAHLCRRAPSTSNNGPDGVFFFFFLSFSLFSSLSF